jgi:hypothetical protein
MANFEHRANSGSIFKNSRKERETHADYQGQALIDGREFFINAWIKEGKSGKFLSLSFKPKDGAQKAKGLGREL